MAEIIVTIKYNSTTKALEVDGPVQDRILIYGMLEMAKDAIHEVYLKAPPQKIMELPMHPGTLVDFDKKLREGGDKR